MKEQQVVITIVAKGEALDTLADVTKWLHDSELPGELIDVEISNLREIDSEV